MIDESNLLDDFMQRRTHQRRQQEKHLTMSYIGTKFIVGQLDPNDPTSDWIYLKVLRSISKGPDPGMEKMKQATAANDQDRAVLDAVRGVLGKAEQKRAA